MRGGNRGAGRPGVTAGSRTSAPAGPATTTDRAAQTTGRRPDTAAAAAWLTADTVTAIGQAMAVSITQHRLVTGRHPTWADARTRLSRRR